MGFRRARALSRISRLRNGGNAKTGRLSRSNAGIGQHELDLGASRRREYSAKAVAPAKFRVADGYSDRNDLDQRVRADEVTRIARVDPRGMRVRGRSHE